MTATPDSTVIDIRLPSALWLAKLTSSIDADTLLSPVADGVPTNWLPTPLATSSTFGGLLSQADVGHGIEPNLSPRGSLPLPGDRVLVARTGQNVEMLGTVVVDGLSLCSDGSVRIGHRPLVRLEEPLDLRKARRVNRLLDQRWDALFGTGGRDRRLLPVCDADVALTFSAFGLSLQQIFTSPPSTANVSVVPALPIWELDEHIDRIQVSSRVDADRVADGVAAYHALGAVFAGCSGVRTVDLSAHRVGRGVLLSVHHSDRASYVVASGVSLGETIRVDETFRELFADDSTIAVVAVEQPEDWVIVELGGVEIELLDGAPGDHALSFHQHLDVSE
jgi:hypothetical protein